MPYATRAAAEIKDKFNIETEIVEGGRGEFSVWVGDKKVAEKGWFRFPPIDKILSGVGSEIN